VPVHTFQTITGIEAHPSRSEQITQNHLSVFHALTLTKLRKYLNLWRRVPGFYPLAKGQDWCNVSPPMTLGTKDDCLG
jgi:hypothetical protein